jgi:hypothetical protein
MYVSMYFKILSLSSGVDRPIRKKGFSLWALTLFYIGGPLNTITFS